MLAGEGDLLPVSALPPDGIFPTATSQWEKRTIASEIPIWEPDLCIDCGKCAIVCPHAAIRLKVYAPEALQGADPSFPSKDFRSKDVPGMRLTVQVAPDDCTGCGVCVSTCPAHDKSSVKRKSINMQPIADHLERERLARGDVQPEQPRVEVRAERDRAAVADRDHQFGEFVGLRDPRAGIDVDDAVAVVL